VGFSFVDLWGLTVYGDVAEEAQGVGFVTPFLVLTGSFTGFYRQDLCVLMVTALPMYLAQYKSVPWRAIEQ
jgi:hypothetical protein